MPRFAANLNWLYAEHAFPDRFAAAARDGFRAVEMIDPYALPAPEVRSRLEANGLEAVLINTPAGDPARGERGLAGLPGREADFDRAFERALEYARVLRAPRIHVMAGLVPEGGDRARHRETFVANVAKAARLAAPGGLMLTLEPINPRDIPGYLLNRQDEAHAIVAEAGAANVKVQMDLYHCQVVEGDLATRIRRHIAGVGHVQVAGVPTRDEPDGGEVHFPYLFDLLDELGYEGWIGCEYRPRAGTSPGLGWMRRALAKS